MPPAGDDRELLSALFDGELDGDAARFALKRLGHDAQWRATCERWQRAGEALRGRGAALTAHGLADRVAAAVAAEPPPTAAVSTRSTIARNWRLGGFAMAASIAAAALFLARPQLPQSPAPDGAQVRVAAAASSARPEPAAAAATAAPMAADATVAGPEELAPFLAAAGSASATTRMSPRRLRSRAAPANTPVMTDTPEAGIAAVLAPDPFTGDSGIDIPVRPWPRAVLPQPGSVFQVGYDPGGASLDPFQLRTPDQADATPDAPPQN